MVNIQFITDIWQRRQIGKATELVLLFRKGHHAKARTISETEVVFEDSDVHLPEERILQLLGLEQPKYLVQNHFTKEWTDVYPDLRNAFKTIQSRPVKRRHSFSPNLVVEQEGEVVYMPHIGEYVIPSDKWHFENGRWIGQWEHLR